jgi:hypothetical protein
MKNIKNSTLLIIFGVLALIVFLFFFYDSKRGERSFRCELFTIDSARVSRFTIYPKNRNMQALVLSGSGRDWKISGGNKSWAADTTIPQHLISSLLRAKPEGVAGTDKSYWKELGVTDTSSIRVVVEQGKDVAADFRVGTISYSRDGQNLYGRQGMSVKSHLRVAGDDRVYVVDGFLSIAFRDDVSAYRVKQLCRFDRNQVNKLTLIYPGDSSFVLLKQENKWVINGKPADSAATANYLTSLANLSNSEFADETEIPLTYSHTLRIEGTNIPVIELQGMANEAAKKYFVKSNMNSSAIFGGANSSLFRMVFQSKEKFLNPPPKAQNTVKGKPAKKKSH